MNITTDLVNSFVKDDSDKIFQIMGVYIDSGFAKFLLLDENNQFCEGQCREYTYLLNPPKKSVHVRINKQLLKG